MLSLLLSCGLEPTVVEVVLKGLDLCVPAAFKLLALMLNISSSSRRWALWQWQQYFSVAFSSFRIARIVEKEGLSLAS